MRSIWQRKDFRTFAILMGAFASVGLATSITLYFLMSQRIWRDARAELLTVARLMSLQVDGDRHELLNDEKQMGSPLYEEQNLKLAKAQAQAPGVRYVYTMRSVGDQIYFVLDPTPPGDHDGDGVDDKSMLMELYEENDPSLDQALTTGSPGVADEIYKDKWGSFLSGYAPILNSKGRVVAILGVDLDASSLESSLADIRLRTILGFGLSLLAGAVLASMLSRRQSSRVRLDSSILVRAFQRNGTLKIHAVALGIIACTMVTGALGFLLLRTNGRSAAELDESEKNIHSIRSHLERFAVTQDFSVANVDGMMKDPAFGAFPSFSSFRAYFAEQVAKKDPGARKTLGELMEMAQGLHVSIQHDRESLALESANSQSISMFALFASVGLSLGAFVLLRFAQTQQNHLVATTEAANQAQLSYRLVVESLPIGFFRYQKGEISFSNSAFDHQTLRTPEQSASEAFFGALIESDQQSTINALAGFEEHEATFELYFTLPAADGENRYFKSRGVPVFGSDGAFDHLVCFNLDITDMVHATSALQQRTDEIEESNEQLQAAITDLETNFSAMVMAFVKAIEAKDPYTAGHSERVMRYSVLIAQAAGLGKSEIELLRKAALVHDVGKIGIPDGILTKPSLLTNEEFSIIQKHVSIGAEMIRQIPLFQDCVPIVKWHHERLDGSGYPDGLSGDELPDIVRIAAVADAFDAMTSTRAYRKGMSAPTALLELEKDVANGKLDAKFVALLTDIINEQGVIDLDEELLAA